MKYDIVVIGAGSVGLSFACSMSNLNVKVLLVEKFNLKSISIPKDDGIEVALTHSSLDILKKIGIWDLINQKEISPLKEAKVFDGNSPSLLNFKTGSPTIDALGYLVPNHQIKRALYLKVVEANNIDILTDTVVENVTLSTNSSQVVLSNERKIDAKLVIAADSRLSNIRRKVGIPAMIKDFSKVMVVVKMSHELPHNNVALECFDYGRTLALLPVVGNNSSIVLTVSADKAKVILDMPEADFNQMVTTWFKGKLGEMSQQGKRYSYPLVASHAKTFIAKRFVLIGDASVGMHPVTAHGFNLGLRGQSILAALINEALDSRQDIGSEKLLKSYEKKHIYLTKLMFFGTNGIVALFTNDNAKQIRKLVLKLAERFSPIKYLISKYLTKSKSNKSLFSSKNI